MTAAAPVFRHDAPGTPVAAWSEHPSREAVPRLRPVDRSGGPVERLVVVAAHPDDETLGAGGLIATLAGHGRVSVVLLTGGEASHPSSPTHDPRRLAALRRQECRAALDELGRGVDLVCWDVGDGRVAEAETWCTGQLAEMVGQAEGVLLVGPWRHDGHPDHEAAGRICAAAAARTGARLLEYPVWFWHWGDPAAAPWPSMTALPLEASTRAAKRAAVGCHGTQVTGLGDRRGDEPVLPPTVLEHFDQPCELFVEQPPSDLALDRLHRDSEEPWHVDTRWYEERKRALVMAMLPARRHGRALDIGCSTGALTLALAERCSGVLAVDSSEAAVASARHRLRGHDHVVVERRDLPRDWPPGRFDLVVVSEVGYFLSPTDLAGLVSEVDACLADDGLLLLSHWRHPVRGWPLTGQDVHEAFETGIGWPRLAAYCDRDVEMLLLGNPSRMPEPSG